MAALRSVPTVDIFQQARNRIETHINKIIQFLDNKQTELFGEINKLEREFRDKQQQKQKEMNKLTILKSQAENLTENNLLNIQQNVVREIQLGIDKLTKEKESTKEPDYKLEIEWGICFDTLFSQIGVSRVNVRQLVPSTHSPKQKPIKSSNKQKIQGPRNTAYMDTEVNCADEFDTA